MPRKVKKKLTRTEYTKAILEFPIARLNRISIMVKAIHEELFDIATYLTQVIELEKGMEEVEQYLEETQEGELTCRKK